MVIRCENCGQPAVEGDINCWHCGQRLSASPAAAGSDTMTRAKIREQWQRPFSLSDAAVYGGMTALVIVGLLAVLVALGRFPLVQKRIGQGLPDDWAYLAGDELAFTLALPANWQIWQAAEASRQVNETELYQHTLLPFGEQAPDLTPRFLALAPPRPNGDLTMLAVIAQSEALGRLTSDQAITLAQRNENVLTAEYRSNFDRSGVFLDVEQPQSDPPLRCWQYLTGGRDSRPVLLLSLCAPAGRFGVYQETMIRILDNFESLRQE